MTNILTIIRKTPPFRGKFLIIKKILGKSILKMNDIEITLKNSVKLKLPNIIEHSCFEMYANGTYENNTIELLLKYLPKDSILIDIGANIGVISVQIAIKRPDVTVFSIEASPIIFEYLQNNIKLNNLKNVIPFNIAIHEKSGITLPFYSPKDKIGCGSFNPIFTDEAIAIECISLDDFIIENNIDQQNIGIIKIDIEGSELLALKGATNYLKNKNAAIYFEFIDWAEELAGFKKGDAQQFLLDNKMKLTNCEETNPSIITTPLTKGDAMILAKH